MVELLMESNTRRSRWFAIAAMGLIAASLLCDGALAQSAEVEHGQQVPLPQVHRNQVMHGRQ
jgi:hypothetical protein